jgi:alpha-L-rhamnosidase
VTDRGGSDVQSLIGAALPADVALDPPTPAIGFVHRRLRDADVYFLANTSNVPRSVRARFVSQTEWAESWDAMSGAVEPLDVSGGSVTFTFEPYGSRVIVFRAGRNAASTVPARRAAESLELRSGWMVNTWGPASAGPTSPGRPVDLPHSWADDPRTRFFSGTVSYRRSVQVPPPFRASGARVFLDFGDGAAVEREGLPGGTMRGNSFAALLAPPIREAATVFVNDRRAGTIWAPPFRVDITDLLHDASNEIRIDVYNTAINQLAEGGRLPDVAAVTERYGQRFRLQDVDNFTPIPSGILAIPRLIVER